jgi:hypothetical protein
VCVVSSGGYGIEIGSKQTIKGRNRIECATTSCVYQFVIAILHPSIHPSTPFIHYHILVLAMASYSSLDDDSFITPNVGEVAREFFVWRSWLGPRLALILFYFGIVTTSLAAILYVEHTSNRNRNRNRNRNNYYYYYNSNNKSSSRVESCVLIEF